MKVSSCEPTKQAKGIYPSQCSCGHLYLEKYQFKQPTPSGYIGFCWCGFCKTRYNVKPFKEIGE